MIATRIPVRDDRGALLGYQKDADGNIIETARRDDILGAAADAALAMNEGSKAPDYASGPVWATSTA